MNGLCSHGKKTYTDMKIINNFLSNKNNLTLLQCLLYGVLGYLLKGNYNWGQFIIVFIILFGIQFITHIKAVATGMMLRHMMEEEGHAMMKFIKQLEKKSNEEDKDLPN